MSPATQNRELRPNNVCSWQYEARPHLKISGLADPWLVPMTEYGRVLTIYRAARGVNQVFFLLKLGCSQIPFIPKSVGGHGPNGIKFPTRKKEAG